MARTARALFLFVAFVGSFIPAVALGQSFDLTGFWQDNNGTPYRLRQVGSELYWYMDGAPRVVNVFAGRIAGREVTGVWADLPGGELRNSGQLALRIESNDRFVKIGESLPYGGSVWTRQGTTAAAPPPPPVAPAPSAAASASWGTNATAYRGQNGRHITFVCPPSGNPGSVWGTDVYTDDSSICTAAVHVGLINTAMGGTVEIEIRPGLQAYVGSPRNGIGSAGYGAWHGSYVFTRAAVAPSTAAQTLPIAWGAHAASYRGQNGQRMRFLCPASGTPGGVWGTDVYTDDSSICTAAVHVGLISTGSGGPVQIEIRPGLPGYVGSARNGVSTAGYGAWHGSYVFVGR